MPELTQSQITALNNALDANTTTSQTNLPNVGTGQNLSSPNAAENSTSQSPSNVPIAATGNASTAATGIKKSNQNVAHACDSSTYVGKAVFEAGAIGGKIVQAIRDGIKAILKFFGINPSSNGISSQLKKLAQYVKDTIKYITDMTTAINGYITYINAIKQLITYVLSLPARLLAYFADCIKTLEKQLVAGFQSALDNVTDTSDNTSSAIKDVQSQIQSFTQSVATLAKTATAAVASLTTLNQTPTSNSQAQAAATQQVFAAAGFAPTSGNYSKA
jgi:hypothetical protein